MQKTIPATWLVALFKRRVSVTTVMTALSTTVALIAGHIIFVSAQLEDRTTLMIVVGMVLMLAWGVSWLVPKAITESVEQHSDILRALLTGSKLDGKSIHENEMADESEAFRQLAENVNEVFWVADAEGKMLQYASPAFEKIWGQSIDDLDQKNKTWIDTINIVDREKITQILDQLDKEPFDVEFRINRADGDMRWIRSRGFPVQDEAGNLRRMVGIAEDITKSKIVDLAKTEFVSLASHQLRTPLSTLKWAVEVLSEDVSNFNEIQTKLLTNAQAAIVRMGESINAMLTASRVQSGQVTPQTRTVHLCTLLQKIVETYEAQASKKKLEVTVECDEGIDVITDENMLVEIISNLLSNAIHYTNEGGKITIQTEANEKENAVVISVADNGIGVPEEDQPMLFSKLFRGKNAMLVDTNGTGLGLYVTKSLTDVLKGKVFFHSTENKGSTFSIRLPLNGPQ